jgi:integrase/recombinase XerD
MNSNKINILFVISSSRIRKDTRASLTCRITYDKIRKTFSTGLFVRPNNWNSKQQIVKPPEPNADILNLQLSLINTKINRAFLMLQVKETNFTVEDIYSTYKGEKKVKEYNTIEFFNRYLDRLKRLVGIDIKIGTWKKFEYVKEHVQTFIKWKYKASDYPLKNLKQQFLVDLEYYLKTEKHLAQATINKLIQRLRKPVKIAISEGYLDRDPFMLHKSKRVKKEIVFLSPEELQALENHSFSQPKLQLVQNLFVFSCYTGLPYNELMNLKQSNIIKGFDGNLWIKMKREKTAKELSIPLLPKALEIIELYSNEGFVFPRISNQRYNSYLKEVADLVGIEKKMTTHMARRTFASTVLLYNDVPMEVVSELLGHSSMKITQDSYGKVVQKKISLEMNRLKGSG